MAKQSFTTGVAQNLTKNNFTKDGYDFVGWTKKRIDSDISDYDDNELYTASNKTNKVTLYALWNPKIITITFDDNDPISANPNIMQTYGKTYSLPSMVPVRSGYVFKGWYTEKNVDNQSPKVGEKIDNTVVVKITPYTTYYAAWDSETTT